MDKKYEVIVVVAVFLVGFYLWTLPFQDQKIPYGEGDASINYFLANHMATTDKAIVKLPPSTYTWRLNDRPINPNNYLFYPPQFHTNFAIMQRLNNPVVGNYFYIALFCSSVFFTVYFLFKRLYGFITALLAGLLILFSFRDQLTFLWGQWGTGITFAFIPLVLYSYYTYTEGVLELKDKRVYVYLMTLVMVFQFLFHPLGFFIALAIMGVYTILLYVKYRKVAFKYKDAIYCTLIFLVLVVAFAPLQIPQITARMDAGIGSTEELPANIGLLPRIFGWYNFPGGYHGVPDWYFSFSKMYYGFWMLPFLFIGLAYLALNRRRKDLFVLSTVIAFYLITHLDLIGILLGAKYPRIFYFESIMLYPIIALGVTSVTSFVNFKHRDKIRCFIIIAFIIAVFAINFRQSYTLLDQTYDGMGRLNTYEIEGIDWINENIKGSYLLLAGAPTFKQQAWTAALVPENVVVFQENSLLPLVNPDLDKAEYIIFDYTYLPTLIRLGYMSQDMLNLVIAYEHNVTDPAKLVYDNQGIYKVYQLG